MLLTLILALSAAPVLPPTAGPAPPAGGEGRVVVANRGDGTLSVIDCATDTVVQTLALPTVAAPEPMYVATSRGRLFVGDRAGSCVAVFRAADLVYLGAVPTGDGVFHMAADPLGRELWVVGDVDLDLTVIDPRTLVERGRVALPADLVALGGVPHDVTLDARFAYVTVTGLPGDADAVLKLDRRTRAEVGRVRVGDAPHVALHPAGATLFVASQGANAVHVLERATLAPLADVPVPGAHGTWAFDPAVFYTTNLPGGGADGVVALDAATGRVLGAADTPYAVPHNLAANRDGTKLYVTHSGATSDRVTVYDVSPGSPVPRYRGEIEVGLNPYGIGFAGR